MPEEPSVCDLVTEFGINILWHPSLGMEFGDGIQQLLRDCISGAIKLDVFVLKAPLSMRRMALELGIVLLADR